MKIKPYNTGDRTEKTDNVYFKLMQRQGNSANYIAYMAGMGMSHANVASV